MSDMFDHELDAFESRIWEEDGGPITGESGELDDPDNAYEDLNLDDEYENI